MLLEKPTHVKDVGIKKDKIFVFLIIYSSVSQKTIDTAFLFCQIYCQKCLNYQQNHGFTYKLSTMQH